MSDRELLELAAKAAGIALYWAEDDPECDWVQGSYPRIPNHNVLEKWTWKIWNPFTDDGDALRLAVKLKLGISIPVHQTIRADVVCFRDSSINIREEGGDPYAATRRAIVRAAAEIGRGKT